MSAMLSMVTLLLALPSGWAGTWECTDCCRAAGLAGCPTTLRVYGDGSLAEREGTAWRIKGLWRLDCADGVRFEQGATALLAETPRAGQVLRLAAPPATVRCFQQSCALPGGACLFEDPDAQFRLGHCLDGEPLTAAEMLRPPVAPPTVTQRTGNDSVPQRVEDAAVAAAAVEPPVEVVPLPEPIALGLVLSAPPPPPSSCQVADALRIESRKHVALGDQARLAGDWARAAQEYQAALTLNRCDAPGWTALGLLALRGGQWDTAREALVVATRLDPEHYRALTALGEAEEQRGARQAAISAYRAALAVQPEHAPATWGLARLGE